MTHRIATAESGSQTDLRKPVLRLLDDQSVDADAFGWHQRVAAAISELINNEGDLEREAQAYQRLKKFLAAPTERPVSELVH